MPNQLETWEKITRILLIVAFTIFTIAMMIPHKTTPPSYPQEVTDAGYDSSGTHVR